jgi:hypothetical protein
MLKLLKCRDPQGCVRVVTWAAAGQGQSLSPSFPRISHAVPVRLNIAAVRTGMVDQRYEG